MKFPVDKCWDCGLDLTTAEPAEVTYPGNELAVGTCPGCLRTYFMVEVTPPSPEAEAPEPAPEAEPAAEAEPEPEPEAEPEPEPEPAAEAEPEPETPGEEKGGD